MSSIPSELIYVFNPDELRLYHLNINDPGEDAIRNDKEANNYGLAMDVYLQRKGVANYKCTPLFPDISEDENTGLIKLNKYNNCIESVMQNGE